MCALEKDTKETKHSREKGEKAPALSVLRLKYVFQQKVSLAKLFNCVKREAIINVQARQPDVTRGP